ncbi:Mitochondrial carrier domain [Pseudocohnilembus persalinus]|uniref:Mitochondrial carrier domain n=1 Tax=Pseudocohnilembus persalinus TaxID=266149 RepID=A0A0V0QKL1_PSEPJ|nr:Mitochondrial carrier domain [Pseudocohnilembus persalinus]|eukprot:KRX02797.1 Mitochondrial carrier domain [Pseudocohnilembus persalinus]
MEEELFKITETNSEKQHISAKDIFLDFFSGSLAGFGICLSGHPFDTIKVRMQMSQMSILQAVTYSYKNYGGIKSFFAGMSSPLTTVPLVNAIVFGSYEFFKRINGVKDENSFSFSQGLFAGMFAGFTNSFVVGPIEMLKCRLQVQNQMAKQSKDGSFKLHKGPVDLLKVVYQTEGIKGVFKGQIITQLREILCYAAQFSTFEGTKKLVLQHYNQTELNHFQSFFLGGLAGISCWLFSYPQDIIKTKLQVDLQGQFKKRFVFNNFLHDGGIIDCYQSIVQKEGHMGLWRGFSACLIRAFYANSVGFLIYEACRKQFFPVKIEEN